MADPARRREIRSAAHRLLERHRIQGPPVPVRRLAEAEGLTVAEMHWGPNADPDAFLIRNKKAIALNVDMPRRRQNFSLAHELGHYILNHDAARLYGANIDIDHPPETTADADLENEANEFAGELLVPRHFLERYVKRKKDTEATNGEEFSYNPFADLAKKLPRNKSLSKKELSDLFEVSQEVIFIALSKHGLL